MFTHAKHRVRGAYLIDDRPATIRLNRDRGMLLDRLGTRRIMRNFYGTLRVFNGGEGAAASP